MPVNPTSEQIAPLAELAGSDADGPLVMLNLNRYRERASYATDPPGGGSPDVAGREAYERYAATALAVLTRLGGEIVWHGRATMTVIGGAGETWDEVIAVRYPSARAFIALATDPDIVTALAHRNAGLERAVLIRCDEEAAVPAPAA